MDTSTSQRYGSTSQDTPRFFFIYEEFKAGHFTAQKTKRVFSAMPIDQAHEENNACVKGDGGAVGLTENPSALRRWMIAGPEVARVIGEFEKSAIPENRRVDTHHHASVQISFAKDVRPLLTVIEDMGNPFEEDSQDLLVLDTKEIADPAVVKTVRSAKSVGQDQFDAFTKECLIDRTKSIYDTIHRNKLPLFSTPASKASKGKQQLNSLKCDVELFYISAVRHVMAIWMNFSDMSIKHVLHRFLPLENFT